MTLRVIFVLLGAVVWSQAAVIYDNTSFDLGLSLNYVANQLEEAGDQVSLARASSSFSLTAASLEIFNENTDDTLTDATLRLYQVMDSTLGTLIGSFTLPGVTVNAGSIGVLAFTLPDVAVPNEIVWTLEFSNSSGLGLNLYNPPTIGSSDPASAWFRAIGGTLQENVFAGDPPERNFNAQFRTATAVVPEPSTLILAGLSLAGGLLWCRRRIFNRRLGPVL